MNITLNNIDPVNATLTVNVVKDDYASQVKKELKKIKDTASIPGFRKGMAPQGMIQKMYGKSVLVDEVNKLVSDSLYKYIQENKLNVLGEPMPSEAEQAPLDFDNQTDYEFVFDLGLSPEIDVKLTKRDKMPYYTITVEDSAVESQINSLKANYGTYEQVEDIQDRDMVKGLLVELNPDGSEKEGGIYIEDAVLMPSFMKDEAEKTKFMSAKLNDVLVFNPYKAYEGNEAELASFLKIDKEEVKEYTGDFKFRLQEITRYKEAEVNQELFDKIYGEGVVKSEDELKAKIKDELTAQMAPESDYKFLLDSRDLFLKKTKDVVFPDAFLKRWLIASNPERTEESLETDYPKIIDDLRFHLVKEQIVKEKEIKVEYEDIKEYARRVARMQFAQYGMANVPDDLLNNYAEEMVKKEENVRNLIDRAVEDKVVAAIKEMVALQPKEVTMEEFRKLVETN
ncbi:trigger factor [Bacteroidales bacterium OttesenSCG-928-J19]|nr:trigger factor [Bacteroidales bacterium OttesenSCG-928-J19]